MDPTYCLQDGKQKKWDLMKSHDSVAILIHHVERDSMLFVRQFRPAVFFNRAYKVKDGMIVPPVGTAIDGDTDLGFTLELCAGIVDKDKSLEEIAAEEVHEECGFKVPCEQMKKVAVFRTGLGTTGSEQTLFYTEVTEAMRDTMGGGNPSELEMIETVEVPLARLRDVVFDENLSKASGFAFAIMWFLKERYRPRIVEVFYRNTLEIGLISSGISLVAVLTSLAIWRLLT
ncbi:uridine diphosphate glucose pyrophosphatase NUDT14-like isoform X2 [Watersipora subatra]|uniref:uridine diphosphate glucose pyrophosphatase NUDT14-like isoform X2 n=1 Tax=Watersipora subatra TaxID=2589382 RepID=UPI00355ADE76